MMRLRYYLKGSLLPKLCQKVMDLHLYDTYPIGWKQIAKPQAVFNLNFIEYERIPCAL